MTIEYTLTREDWAAFGDYCARTSPGFRKAARAGSLSGALSMVVGSGFLWWDFGSILWLAGGVVAAALWAIWWPRRLRRNVRTHMARRERLCLRGTHMLEALPTGLHAKCDVTDAVIQWKGVNVIAETPRHVLVMLSDVQGYVVPKGGIISGELSDFLASARQFLSDSRVPPESGGSK